MKPSNRKTNIESKKELSFDWKSISKEFESNAFGLEVFIKESKNKIAIRLIEEVKKRGYVPDLLRRCKSQYTLNGVVTSEDDVWGEVDVVISSVVERWEVACRSEVANVSVKHSSIDGALRMDTYNDIMGYFRCALRNAFADLHTFHSAQKRSAKEINFSVMSARMSESGDERLFEDTLTGSDHLELEHRLTKVDMLRVLSDYDKKEGTGLSTLFIEFMDQSNDCPSSIQKKLGLSNKDFNEQKRGLSGLLIKHFGEFSAEIIGNIQSHGSSLSDLRGQKLKSGEKKNKKNIHSLPEHRVNVVYGERSSNSMGLAEYYVSLTVDRLKNKFGSRYSQDNWERIYSEEKTLRAPAGGLSEIKPRLKKLIGPHVEASNRYING